MTKPVKVFQRTFNAHLLFRRLAICALVVFSLAALSAVSNNSSSKRWSAPTHTESTADVARQAQAALFEAEKQQAQAAKLESDRQHALQAQQAKPLPNMLYFNDANITSQLGCPASNHEDQQLNFTCFFHNPNKPSGGLGFHTPGNTSGCDAIFHPLPADDGRPWCISTNPAKGTLVQDALDATHADDMVHLNGTTLLLGTLSGPNPTHQLNIHFYHIYKWMKEHQISMGALNIVVDCYRPDWCLGTYGIGLARAFGALHFLPELPQLTSFDELKFSMPVGFPFDLHKYEMDKTLDCDFVELTWGVKQHYGIDPRQIADPRKVVLAVRKPSESRALTNSAELMLALEERGFEVTVATFGNLTFPQQLETVSDASVLVGVTGSDLINLVFLPLASSVVEIFPVALGKQVFTPELWNLAHMTGKNHLKYVSPYNSTLMLDSEGKTISDKPVHQVKATQVHVPSLVALVEAAALAADLEKSVWNRISLESRSAGDGIRCFDRTV